MEKRQIAKIAVSAAIYSIDRPYSYLVPAPLVGKAVPGVRVTVPFGKGNRRTEGIVLSVSDEAERENLKLIDAALDDGPVFTAKQLELALWMRDRFFCTFYDVARAMLPTAMWFRDGERIGRDKMEKFVSLAVPAEEAAEAASQKRLRAPQQAAILSLMASVGEAAAADIRHFTGASAQSLKALVSQGYLEESVREVLRTPLTFSEPQAAPIALTAEQQRVYDGLAAMARSGKASAALLFGVTGSGKTSIYIDLVRDALERGKTAIVLVPEIALTPQLVGIFSAHFGDQIAVLHSSLGMGERYDEWKRIRSGKVRVVIGTRSAIFAPLEDLGLIVIDEEQEHTYKSENNPRYHARDVAKYLCVQAGALLLLGSATPSVESMYAAQNGKYKLFRLENRYNQKPLPRVTIADMRQELKNGNGGSLSAVLREELGWNIENGEQSILFINRRGAANLVVCGECGYTFTCPNCSVSMTYHSVEKRLMCHYCGHTERPDDRCPACGGRLNYVGAGTQRVEEELHALFPEADILRMDMDTVTRAGSHEKILSEFREGKAAILLGTQMVTKGLDFENVTLVGVLSADQSLYISDYRAHERTFDLITQVVGRSGRGDKDGRAVIQTYTPENEVIRLASEQDYMRFYEGDIALRRALSAPPIADMFCITVSGPQEARVLAGCVRVRKTLEYYFKDVEGAELLGPAPAAIAKVNNRFRYKLFVTCANTRRVRDILAHTLREFAGDSKNRGISAFADINPLL